MEKIGIITIAAGGILTHVQVAASLSRS